jgi:hypothetical protein
MGRRGHDVSTPEPVAVIGFLYAGLVRTLPPDAMAWFAAELDRQQSGVDERRLAVALGLTGRKLGRAELSLPAADLAAAQRLRMGWQRERWGANEAARVALLLATWRGDEAAFAADHFCRNMIPRLWRPLPASIAGGAGARPDQLADIACGLYVSYCTQAR